MIRSLLLLVFGTTAGTVNAAQTVASVDASGFIAFHALDSDSNGYVSRVEARTVTSVERAFSTADANRDGLLDRAEYERVRPGREVR